MYVCICVFVCVWLCYQFTFPQTQLSSSLRRKGLNLVSYFVPFRIYPEWNDVLWRLLRVIIGFKDDPPSLPPSFPESLPPSLLLLFRPSFLPSLSQPLCLSVCLLLKSDCVSAGDTCIPSRVVGVRKVKRWLWEIRSWKDLNSTLCIHLFFLFFPNGFRDKLLCFP